MSKLSDKAIAIAKEKGLLAFAELNFDNNVSCSLFNTRGYVTISETSGLIYWYSVMDSSDTGNIEDQAVSFPSNIIGQQQTIYVTDLDAHMQGFNIAQYSHYCFYWDSQTVVHMPTIPTPEEIMAYTLTDSNASIYSSEHEAMYEPYHIFNDAATVKKVSGDIESVVSLYPDDFNYHSAAAIGWWQMWYKNHEKFKTAIASAYDESGLI